MLLRCVGLAVLFLITIADSTAQIGGEHTYDFLNLSSSARVAALGGNAIAVKDDDPNLAFTNPSLLNEEMDFQLAFNYINYFADINYGVVSFSKHIDSLKGTFNLGIKYVDYGVFEETDAIGNTIGEFTAGEYAFLLGYGRALDSNFSVGANLKMIYSSLYNYTSTAAVIDLGATYENEDNGFTTALVIKNIGTQLSTYGVEKENIPFELQMGVSKRFKNVPLRLGLIAHHLNSWDLAYVRPDEEVNESPLFGAEEEKKNKNGFMENLARHLIINAEFLITENVNFRLGYNYFRRSEMLIEEKLGTVGLSWGVGFRISKFHLSYGRSAYHQAGASNTFSVTTRLTDFVN